MTKSENRELLKIIGYLDETNLRGMAARSLAALIRSARAGVAPLMAMEEALF